MSQRGRGSVVLSRLVVILAGVFFLAIVLGCMSISFGGLSICSRTEEDGTFTQEGDVHLLSGQERDVYYPASYASPPNLELSGDVGLCEIVEQRPDHFHVRNLGPGASPHWKARGVRNSPVQVIVPAASPTPPPLTGPTLPPPAPVPVSP
jgi:hypothetical protein